MTKLKFIVAILICFNVSPVFGQLGGGKTFTLRNDTNRQMQLRFRSPEGSFYDQVQRVTRGRTQEFQILSGWQAYAEFPSSNFQPQGLSVEAGKQYRAFMQDNFPVIRSLTTPANPDSEATKIIIKNDTNMGLTLQMKGPGSQTGRQPRIESGKSLNVRLISGWTIEGVLDNGISMRMPQPKEMSTYRIYGDFNGFHWKEETAAPTPTQNTKEEKIARQLGLTIRPNGAGQVLVMNIQSGSIADQLRVQRGDTLTEFKVESARGPWGEPVAGFLFNGFTVRNDAGYEMKVDLKATGKAMLIR